MRKQFIKTKKIIGYFNTIWKNEVHIYKIVGNQVIFDIQDQMLP